MVKVAESSWHAAAIDALAIGVTYNGNRLYHEIGVGESRKREGDEDFHLQIVMPWCKVSDVVEKCCSATLFVGNTWWLIRLSLKGR